MSWQPTIGVIGVGMVGTPLKRYIARLEQLGFTDEAELLRTDRLFNEQLLAQQRLTLENISVQDSEWIQQHIAIHKDENNLTNQEDA